MSKVWMGVASAMLVAASLSGCGGDSSSTGSGGSSSSSTSSTASASSSSTSSSSGTTASQTPPEGMTALEAWLALGDYKSWKCESAPHMARSPSPHTPGASGGNRICVNDLLSANATKTGPFPKGAAAVKEIYSNLTDATPAGYAVYLKTADDSAAGANWYWYERAGTQVYADGRGSVADVKTACVDCHAAAGSDAMHTPTPNGHDFVYTPIP